jgi:hypothetical protein
MAKYWRRVSSEAWARTTRLGLASGYRRATSVFIPLGAFAITAIVLRLMDVGLPLTAAVGFGAAVLSYALGIGVEYLYHFVSIPAQSDAQQRDRIRQLEGERQSSLIVDIQSVTFALPYQVTRPDMFQMTVFLRLRNAGPPTTVDDWRLSCPDRPDLRPAFLKFDFSIAQINMHPIVDGGACTGHVAFHVGGMSLSDALKEAKTIKWYLQFSDAKNRTTEIAIPQSLLLGA